MAKSFRKLCGRTEVWTRDPWITNQTRSLLSYRGPATSDLTGAEIRHTCKPSSYLRHNIKKYIVFCFLLGGFLDVSMKDTCSSSYTKRAHTNICNCISIIQKPGVTKPTRICMISKVSDHTVYHCSHKEILGPECAQTRQIHRLFQVFEWWLLWLLLSVVVVHVVVFNRNTCNWCRN